MKEKDKDAIQELIVAFIAIFMLISIMLGIVWFFASQEAASYRKFCDKPVTTWDALFLDLRIDECNKGK